MTDIEITPKVLRALLAVAMNDDRLSDDLCTEIAVWAKDLDPIETWAEFLHNAAAPIGGAWVDYEEAPTGMRETARRQARAVLAKLEADSLTTPCADDCGDPSPHDAHLAPGALDRLSSASEDRVGETDSDPEPTFPPCLKLRPTVLGDPFRCSLRAGHAGPHEAWFGPATDRTFLAAWEDQ
ncbi:hypothetical protein BO226_17605 [Rhodococcus sp. 2G]|uniref:hypothetical protein n=1 Tax=Rhodococcus sp. 2G TaxID=1570939 RepID=UPI000903368A|nr:hypothetical protein [Rhodococcus sp. 2G]APE10789.1 hypothetical protein BO226_17605 [Rhodococcus sp. 2G]